MLTADSTDVCSSSPTNVIATLENIDHSTVEAPGQPPTVDLEYKVEGREQQNGPNGPKDASVPRIDSRQKIEDLIKAGKEHYDGGELERAAKCYQSALDLRQDSRTALYSLGVISGRLKRYQEARALFNRLIKLLEESDFNFARSTLEPAGGGYREVIAAAKTGLGQALLCLWGTASPEPPPQDLAVEAEREFRSATELDPGSFGAWAGLGISRHILERLDDAEAAFRRALEIEPGSEITNERLRAVLEDKLERQLFELGYLSKINKPIHDFTPYENRTYIEVEGEPLSEIIIEERR